MSTANITHVHFIALHLQNQSELGNQKENNLIKPNPITLRSERLKSVKTNKKINLQFGISFNGVPPPCKFAR